MSPSKKKITLKYQVFSQQQQKKPIKREKKQITELVKIFEIHMEIF